MHNCTLSSLRLLMLSLMLFCGILRISGQQPSDFQLFVAGPVIGLNLSQVDGDNYAGFNKPGLMAGGVVHAMIHKNWSLSMEILFNQKGSKSPRIIHPSFSLKQTFNYIEVPFQINYHDQDRLIFGAGASFSNLFSASRKVGGLDSPNILDSLDRREVSFLLTGTFMIREHFGAGFRYSQSITSFGPSDNPAVQGLINRLISFRMSYLF